MEEKEVAETNKDTENTQAQSQLNLWRRDLIRLLLRWLLVFSFFAISAASYYSYNQGDLYLLPYYWAVVVILALITLWPRISFGVQSWTLISLIYFGALINFLTEGRASLGRLMLLTMTMGSMLFFGLKFGITMLILSVLTMAGFAWAFSAGLITDYDLVYSTQVSGWISNTFMLVLLAIFAIYSLHYLIARYTATLAESYKLTQALEISQANLEEQVAERTRSAELARQEAEKANQALEVQLEFARAQAKLNDVLRGERQIPTLADDVLSQLCRDLKFPVGALFILEQGVLSRVGRYAFPADSTLADQFELGEGLVGQAALEKRLISVPNIPADSITISSGLGQTPPVGLLIVPLIYNEQVIGVLEFGLLRDEVEKERRFLERVSESIAMAFNITQDRNRIDQLLSETQRQAEELQVQEEELRAANEELQEQARALRSGHDRA
jgi:hypothetical protein